MNKFIGVDILRENKDGAIIEFHMYGIYDKQEVKMRPELFKSEADRDNELLKLNKSYYAGELK